MPTLLLLVSVPPDPHHYHGAALRKPVTDWGSLMIYKGSTKLGKHWHNQRMEPELRGQIFTPMWYYSFCSAVKFWWRILSSQRSSHLSDCHFPPSAGVPSVCSGIISGTFPGICNWLDWGMMLSRSISLIYDFLTYFILKANWLHYTLQQKELQ